MDAVTRTDAFPVPQCMCWLMGGINFLAAGAGGGSAFVAVASPALQGIPWVCGTEESC